MNETLKNIKRDRTPAEQIAENAQFQAPKGQAFVKRQLIYNAEDRLRDAIQAQRTAKNDPRAKAEVLEATHAVDTLMAKKVISPQAHDNILTDAQSSGLPSLVKNLDPLTSLDVWDEALPEERKELSRTMHLKFLEAKDGMASTEESQEILDRFRAAATQLADSDAISPIAKGIIERVLSRAGLTGKEI